MAQPAAQRVFEHLTYKKLYCRIDPLVSGSETFQETGMTSQSSCPSPRPPHPHVHETPGGQAVHHRRRASTAHLCCHPKLFTQIYTLCEKEIAADLEK